MSEISERIAASRAIREGNVKRRVYENRGFRSLLCCFGIHKNIPVWVLRPETISNPRGANVEECARCGRLDKIGRNY